jgi:NTE family protein
MTTMTWNPTAVWNEVKVSDEQLSQIHQRMAGQPRSTDGKYPADAVFEGGGVWGTAFLGAVRCCEDIGITWVGLAGTSAGAITAGLLAAGYTAGELEDAFAKLDYMEFIKDRTYRFGWDSNPSDDLENAGEVIGLLAALLAHNQLGRYSSDKFHDWYDGLLRAKRVTTFGDVFQSIGRLASGGEEGRILPRQLRVVATDLTNGRLRVLPDTYLDPKAGPLDPNSITLPPALDKLPIAHAVRCSMSIPGFFEPARLPVGDNGGAVIVDGGVLSNFPLWLFDDAPGAVPGWPTFGFRLTEGVEKPRKIETVTQLLRALFRTMMSASDQYYVGKAGGNRIATIDLSHLLSERPHLTATAFNLSGDDQAALYRTGYEAAKEFFLTQWNWAEHVEARTSAPTAVAAAAATGS